MKRARGYVPNDSEQELIETFKDNGATVIDLSSFGWGVPDLVIGFNGTTELVEMKGEGQLSRSQRAFKSTWAGRPVRIVRSRQAVLKLLHTMGLTIRVPSQSGERAE